MSPSNPKSLAKGTGRRLTPAQQMERVRRICAALPETTEKLSHGEPTFFVRKRVFATFSNDHHSDGHVAVLVPAPPGLQEALISEEPAVYYRPAYVGVRGWVGIELAHVSDEQLTAHIHQAWRLIAPAKIHQANFHALRRGEPSSP